MDLSNELRRIANETISDEAMAVIGGSPRLFESTGVSASAASLGIHTQSSVLGTYSKHDLRKAVVWWRHAIPTAGIQQLPPTTPQSQRADDPQVLHS